MGHGSSEMSLPKPHAQISLLWLGLIHTRRISTFACKFGANPLKLLASCVNTPIDHSVFHNLHARMLQGAPRPV